MISESHLRKLYIWKKLILVQNAAAQIHVETWKLNIKKKYKDDVIFSFFIVLKTCPKTSEKQTQHEQKQPTQTTTMCSLFFNTLVYTISLVIALVQQFLPSMENNISLRKDNFYYSETLCCIFFWMAG